MNGYRSKHKILAYYIKKMQEAKSVTPLPLIPYTEFCKNIKGVSENKAFDYLFNLRYTGYFTFYPASTPSDEHEQNVEITSQGMKAYVNREFLIKNKEIFWKSFMNVSITLANIAVAITAIWAIATKENESEGIKAQMLELKQRVHQLEVKPNPSTQHLQSVRQSNTIDSVK